MLFVSKVNFAALISEISKLESWTDGTGALMMVRPSAGLPQNIMKLPTIKAAVQEISDLRKIPALHIMINVLPPDCDTKVHRDFLIPSKLGEKPCVERWHLAVKTNDQSVMWDEISDKEINVKAGMWYGPFPYWAKHYVANRGKTERIHVVVDLDSETPVGEYDEHGKARLILPAIVSQSEKPAVDPNRLQNVPKVSTSLSSGPVVS
jgi:hypothetical protein